MYSHKPKDTQLKSREASVWSSSVAYLLTAPPSHGPDPHLFSHLYFEIGLPRWFSGKEPACQCRSLWSCGFSPWVGKIPWRRKRQPTPVFLPGQRSLVGCSLWGLHELDVIEHTHSHTRSETGPAYWCTRLYPGVPGRGSLSYGHSTSQRERAKPVHPELRVLLPVSAAPPGRGIRTPPISGVTQALANPNHVLFVVGELSRFKRCLNAQAFSWVSPE